MPGARGGGELGMELHADEPRVHGLWKLHDLRQILGRGACGNNQPGFFQRGHVMVVHLIAMAVQLVHFVTIDALRATVGPAMPGTCRAYSITASGIPRQMPRYGILFSREKRIAAIFPSVPRLPKPPGTRIASKCARPCVPKVSISSESIY